MQYRQGHQKVLPPDLPSTRQNPEPPSLRRLPPAALSLPAAPSPPSAAPPGAQGRPPQQRRPRPPRSARDSTRPHPSPAGAPTATDRGEELRTLPTASWREGPQDLHQDVQPARLVPPLPAANRPEGLEAGRGPEPIGPPDGQGQERYGTVKNSHFYLPFDFKSRGDLKRRVALNLNQWNKAVNHHLGVGDAYGRELFPFLHRFVARKLPIFQPKTPTPCSPQSPKDKVNTSFSLLCQWSSHKEAEVFRMRMF